MAKSDDLYSSFGSVPDVLPQGGFTPGSNVKASPNAAGAQIGGAIQGAGNAAQDIVQKYQGMINETLATNADAQFAMKMGELKGKYKSLTGLEAVNALPHFQNEADQARLQMRSSLPPMAARGFDGLAMRSFGYAVGEMNEYAASQTKEAYNASAAQLGMTAALSAKDPSIAASDEKFGEKVGDIKHSAAMQIDKDHVGLQRNEDGIVTGFKDDEAGQQLKAEHNSIVDHYTGIAWENRLDALAAQDPVAANEKFQAEKKNIPPLAAVRIEAKLAPQVINSYAQGGKESTVLRASQDHAEYLLNAKNNTIADAVYSKESNSGKDTRTSIDGAIGPMQITPDTWETMKGLGLVNKNANINDPIANKEGGRKLINYYMDKYDGDAPRALVAYNSGPGNVSPSGSENPWINDKKSGNGESVSSYVSDTLKRFESKTERGVAAQDQKKPYATNPDGSPVSQADYYASHRDDILAANADYMEKNYPGNLAAATKSRALLIQHMDAAISAQSAQYKQDNNFIQRGITGQLTENNPPSTYEKLMAIPGMSEVLNRSAVHSPQFYQGIDTSIQKMSRRETDNNSANGYETVLRVLQPNDKFSYPNSIANQEHLDSLMGKSDGTGINYKDYQDAKKAIEYPEPLKKKISDKMKEITTANGNIDGKGSERALMWYNSFTKIKGAAEAGKDARKDEELIKSGFEIADGYMPSRIQQIRHLAQLNGERTEQMASREAQSETVIVTDPSGRRGKIPASQLEEAIKSGYKKVE